MVRKPIIEETIFVKNVCSIFFINSAYFAGKDIGISSIIKIFIEFELCRLVLITLPSDKFIFYDIDCYRYW